MKTIVLVFLTLIIYYSDAQISTGINNENPNSKAALDIKGSFTTPQGLLIPRYSTDQSLIFNLSGNNAVGLTYYDTTAGIFRYYQGNGIWSTYGGIGSGSNNWSLTGNSFTAADTAGSGIKFLGTTNLTPLIFMTNGIQRMRIGRNGNLGIGMNPNSGIPVSIKSTGIGQILQIESSAAQEPLFEFRETSNNYARLVLNNGGTNAIQLSAGPDFSTYFKGTYVGINNSSPTARFNVTGWSRFDTLAGSGIASVMVNANGDLYRGSSGLAWSIIGNSGTNNTNFLGTTDNVDLRFRTNNLTRMVIDSATGNIGIGTSTPNGALDIMREGILPAFLIATSHSGTNNANGTSIIMRRSAGTTASGAALVGTDDLIGQIAAQGYTSGNVFANAAGILLEVDSISSVTSMPGRIRFTTTPVGTITPIERMRISNNGRVGIGTTAPLATLHIQSPSVITSNTQFGNLHVSSSNSQTSNLGGSITLGGYNDIAATSLSVFGSIEGRKTTATSGQSSGYLIFKTNTLGILSEQMRIANNGNIGIGTAVTATKKVSIDIPSTNTTEADALSINTAYSGIGSKRGLYINLTSDGSGNHYGIYNDVDGLAGDISPLYGTYNSFTPNGTGTAYGSYTTISNVGTGLRYGAYYELTSGAANVSPIYSTYSRLNVTGTNTHYAYYGEFLGAGTGLKYGIYMDGDSMNYFNGRVGIGTTAPAGKLHVEERDGTIFTSNNFGDGGPGLVINNTSPTDDETTFLEFRANNTRIGSIHMRYVSGVNTSAMNVGTYNNNALVMVTNSFERMRITQAGLVGIGMTPVYQLQLSTNSAAKPTSGTWTVASDARLKKDIAPFKSGLTDVLSINPVWFTYTGKAGMPKETGVGVIAQELQKVAPYMVGTWKHKEDNLETEYLAVDNGAMTYMLVNATKELHEKLEMVTTQNLLLKNEVENLKRLNLQFASEIEKIKSVLGLGIEAKK